MCVCIFVSTFVVAVVHDEYNAFVGGRHRFKGVFVARAIFASGDVGDGGEASVSSIIGEYTFAVDAAFAFCGEREDGGSDGGDGDISSGNNGICGGGGDGDAVLQLRYCG